MMNVTARSRPSPSAYGMEVPFKPVYYMDFLLERMTELQDRIKPLNIKAAYQRPCSNRLIPDKLHLVKEILDLIGVELPDRSLSGRKLPVLWRNSTVRFRVTSLPTTSSERNLNDMVQTGAAYCVFNCPACQGSLSEKVVKKGMQPVHIIELCKMAIGEKEREVR